MFDELQLSIKLSYMVHSCNELEKSVVQESTKAYMRSNEAGETALAPLLQCLKEDLENIDRMIYASEAEYEKWRHHDPYIVPWAPGGSKFHRNPTPPSGNMHQGYPTETLVRFLKARDGSVSKAHKMGLPVIVVGVGLSTYDKASSNK